jgi:Ca-activated chloride channel family protein
MSDLQFQNPYFAIFGVLGLIAWIISYFYFFKKAQIFIPGKYKIKSYPILRTVIFFVGLIGWLNITYALMGPRRPMGTSKNTIEVNDVFIVMDLSRSI